MAEQSAFREALEFFGDIGIYDVVLPFLLVFTIIFAILEKTKVFGMEEVDGVKYTKKNLNAIASFVIAFMVIASSKLVETITTISSQVVILLMLSIFFLLLVGSFYNAEDFKEGVFLKSPWNAIFMIIMFVGIVFIFLQAIKTKSGESWLEWFWKFLSEHWSSRGIASIILLIIIIGFMVVVINPKEKTKKEVEK
ncbi:hypothetical protein CMO89_04040 [Candidatus Woesearchaeota archaeon]|nr:hypothetical protein [Candidatus Woesearchaeota archaeon]|tara:strand:- start:11179 stop:11763 length:585 start_codon:yes stop_codon:yes gene_type:complete